MNDRTLRMIVIHDPNSAESRAMMEALTENTYVDCIELQRVHKILPGVRAVPAVGVLLWTSDTQGVVTDVDNLYEYLKREETVREALAVMQVGAIDDELVVRTQEREDAICAATHHLPDDVAVKMPSNLFTEWSKDGVEYVTSDLRIFEGTLYRCRGDHISSADMSPVNAPSMWRKLPWASSN